MRQEAASKRYRDVLEARLRKYNSWLLGLEDRADLAEIFSYGGDMEMYCQGAGESSPSTVCDATNMFVYYSPGQQSTAAYANQVSNVKIVPIVDGRLDNHGADDLLSPLNNLDQPTASLYADKVAQMYCADDRVAGVQFDIEPFDISKPGQAYFYQEIAKDFAGKNTNPNGQDKFGCVDRANPQGRFFSVFTFSNKVNSQVATIFNQYQNGYVIDSLYDLGPNPGGTINPPAKYKAYVNQEVQNMMQAANTYNVKYQFAIPGAASAHEFESKAGIATGYQQIDYVTAAIQAIDANGARKDEHFLGVNLWSWNQKMLWGGNEYTPATPTQAVLTYLTSNL